MEPPNPGGVGQATAFLSCHAFQHVLVYGLESHQLKNTQYRTIKFVCRGSIVESNSFSNAT